MSHIIYHIIALDIPTIIVSINMFYTFTIELHSFIVSEKGLSLLV